MVGSVRRAVGMSDELSLSSPPGVREGTEVTLADRAWLKMYCKVKTRSVSKDRRSDQEQQLGDQHT